MYVLADNNNKKYVRYIQYKCSLCTELTTLDLQEKGDNIRGIEFITATCPRCKKKVDIDVYNLFCN